MESQCKIEEFRTTQEVHLSPTIKECSKDREHDDAEFEYVFTSNKPGLVILIINSQFDSETARTRENAIKDLQNMQEVFGKLGFEVRVLHNFTSQQLKQALRDVSKEDIMKNIDCLACVISSHGGEKIVEKQDRDEHFPGHIPLYEHFISTKDGEMRTKAILEQFDDNTCHLLKGKPKLFFIQACRSRVDGLNSDSRFLDSGFQVTLTSEIPYVRSQEQNHQSNTSLDAIGETSSSDENEQSIRGLVSPACLNNFLVMFATVSDTYGWSDERGGWLLSSLHDVFQEKISKNQRFSLMAALVEVNRRVTLCTSISDDGTFAKSSSCLEYKLTKEIFFRPCIPAVHT